MNLAFSNILLANLHLDGQFLRSDINTKRSKLHVTDSHFNKITNSIFSSSSNAKNYIADSEFSNILGGAIRINYAFGINDKIYKDRQTWYEATYFISRVKFLNCKTNDLGGGLESNRANFSAQDLLFEKCSAQMGGGAHILRSWECNFTRLCIADNRAEYAAGMHYDSMNEQNTTEFTDINVTSNVATKWTGGLRIDHGGGKLKRLFFHKNNALVASGYMDYAWYPTHKFFSQVVAINNSCVSRGAGMTFFHIKHRASVANSVFIQNRCEKSAHGISVENVDGILTISNCYFDGPQNEQIYPRYNETIIKFVGNENKFDVKSDEIIAFKDLQMAEFKNAFYDAQ
ncbi:hypothetical protein TVAG_101110 [Trichomonas vaginalis G3]|uniref:Right handed beta helix domain-containing protein n=1 Tax=Trichomonas vaginalis (strain ATCC PRA-98 / G3) TaxID=412133 RepID=A2DJJ3_TRIV3|nr:pectin lyase-like family [Trichomonas vaginalis G3]EAY19393.1 hypothetical protein TVAG_101110 [Trichomonas vaginalis G3]KAI5493213.1 pectin lyase-like family [Trichomonas vaginalis G3]|eukprot:XP_001580379.1 hypothetical protein [Trichomonas vaginalis G3]